MTISDGHTGSLRLSRRGVFIWGAIILCANNLASLIQGRPSIGGLMNVASDIGIMQCIAWYAIFRLFSASDPVQVARWHDVAIVTGSCLLLVLPNARIVWIAASAIGAYAWMFSSDSKLRAGGTVVTALAVQEFWGHVFFNLVSFLLLRAETAAVGTLLKATQGGVVWYDNVITGPSGYGILIYSGCSSFPNILLAFLCWVTVSRLSKQNWEVRDFVTAAIIGVTVILLNIVRLYLMALSDALFNFWHHGMGAEIFGVGTSILVLCASLYGSGAAQRHK